ncbi:hypothetical protein Droror1_Dr00010195 [Drosera rotundifolia]
MKLTRTPLASSSSSTNVWPLELLSPSPEELGSREHGADSEEQWLWFQDYDDDDTTVTVMVGGDGAAAVRWRGLGDERGGDVWGEG